MKEYGVFDIIGPIMIGPSSSHTAGAARLGKVAAAVAGEPIKKVEFLLHGSFSSTYIGHGTDRALTAGILGFDPWDERLKDALTIAKEIGIEVVFTKSDLGDVHPNTVKVIMTTATGKTVEVMGSSIGGGSIQISEVDGEKVEFNGEYPTLIIKHRDIPGMISKISAIISEANVNIAFLKVLRKAKGEIAIMVFETDTLVPEWAVEKIHKTGNVESIRVINSTKKGA
ncbi:L-serine ammonia-lyase, iron-sulfur-dependent subunit beta [Clostridium oryzae]|uniref:L-serine deaminase n=1 Tax=Clostridium oryzae TaxID=1450648 RepID=A0A1V4IFH5_9CLOT|nr:L-serine ammonia-lyase, iron-sulfur-dependent subunit beta [Clostridium oryzae]OPJ58267.1 L-serine dehydratase, beta chain [Clostridium oryzae]